VNLRKFYRQLEKVRQKMERAVVSECNILITFDAFPKRSILPFTFCPLTAVARFEEKGLYWNSDYQEAAKQLGFPEEVADQIAKAADNPPCDLNYRERQIRRAMLRALGLD
jgi:hypothetical protein